VKLDKQEKQLKVAKLVAKPFVIKSKLKAGS
jgi:hypothetical protein